MDLVAQIKEAAAKVITDIYKIAIPATDISVNQTKTEFEGDYTIVLFALTKQLKKSPEALGKEIGEAIVKVYPGLFTSFNVIKGFLNLTISDTYFVDYLSAHADSESLNDFSPTGKKIVVEYSSPNTNKPLHLGHLRNNFLGWSIAEILKATGNEVTKTAVVNDRGIHICKSMVAWKDYGKGATPETTGIKGDHLVGDYYVQFNETYKQQTSELMQQGLSKAEAEKEAPVMKETQQMLIEWEEGKPEVIQLWREMNSWVYKGFDETYHRIGSDFDKVYYESETYLLGKKVVEEGLKKSVFYRRSDGSIWIDLKGDDLDEKLLLRSDGTSVYMTQDLGLAQQKYEDFYYDKSIYVVGDEQNYHMNVLQLILQKLGKPYADGIHHLSYGMVELPTGRMKSREGTVVDADDLIDEMVKVAAHHTQESGKVKDFDEAGLKALYDMIGLGALKFYLLRVDPKKRMIFNPEESIDFHGFTGPFVQYTHARIKSILRKAATEGDPTFAAVTAPLLPLEKQVLLLLEQYSTIVQQAATEYNPSVIAIYVYTLAQAFNTFLHQHLIINAETPEKKNLRLSMCVTTAHVIAAAMHLLGIKVPEKM